MSQLIAVSLEEEMKKNPELKMSDIKYLKEWMEKQPHLPEISDSSLALFLHSNYYRIEPTKANIDYYYTIRTHVPDFFAGRNPIGCQDIRLTFNKLASIPLEKTTKEGYNIIFVKLIDPDPSKFVLDVYTKVFCMVLDLWIYRSGTSKGHIVIMDVQDVSLGHATRLSPTLLKKFLVYFQEGLPVRLKGLHYFHITPGMEAIMKIMKPFMKKELLDILHLHPSIKDLEKFVPIECLPNEFGGEAGPIAELHQAQIKELEKHRDWFLQEESQSQVDETKRPGKAKSASDLFGMEGSFKKLDID